MAYVLEAVWLTPLWVWLASAGVALLMFAIAAVPWRAERKRANRAEAQARLWRLLADASGERAFNGKRTRVAPQYHAPRA